MEDLIKKYLEYLKVERNYSDHTVLAYKNDLHQLLHFIADDSGVDSKDVSAEHVSRLAIRLWMGDLRENGISRNSIVRKTTAVRSFFKYCFKRGFTENNPAHLLVIPKKEMRLPATVRPEEMENLFQIIDVSTPEGTQDRAILELMYSSGVRLSELINLNVNDLDFRSGQITVTGKGNRQRIVPVGKHAQIACKNHIQTRNSLFKKESDIDARKALFIAPRGKRMNASKVKRLVKEYLTRAANVSQKSPHVLRHTFATHMLDAGADIRMIKEFLGHINLSSTQIYAHTSMEYLKKVYKQAHPRAESKIQ